MAKLARRGRVRSASAEASKGRGNRSTGGAVRTRIAAGATRSGAGRGQKGHNARPKVSSSNSSASKPAGEKARAHRSETGYECYHCKEWIPPGQAHDCWTTTEAALTAELSDELRDAWERLREAAAELGPQRIYASGTAIMFSRKVCYLFVRPKRRWLDASVFLGRALKGPHVVSARPVSKTKVANIVRITHRDQVEAPLTDWLAEAYALSPEA
jgi:hypothetical protein